MPDYEQNTNNNGTGLDLLRRSSTILDLLNHEVVCTIGADKTLRRLEKVIMQPEVLKSLSFEQIMQYTDKLMRRQKEGREFIIDFYRVTSKSQDIQSVLKQHTMLNSENEQVIEGKVVSDESKQAIKNAVLSKLNELLKEEELAKGSINE